MLSQKMILPVFRLFSLLGEERSKIAGSGERLNNPRAFAALPLYRTNILQLVDRSW